MLLTFPLNLFLSAASSNKFGFTNGINLMPGLKPLTCSLNIPMATQCAPPPPFSVFLFNQSSRAYDCSKDAPYLMGIDPSSGKATNALLGPYAGSYTGYECEVVNSTSGSKLLWSAIYVR